MAEYMSGRVCYRVVLDRVMDGTKSRVDCQEDEVLCGVCVSQRRQAQRRRELEKLSLQSYQGHRKREDTRMVIRQGARIGGRREESWTERGGES